MILDNELLQRTLTTLHMYSEIYYNLKSGDIDTQKIESLIHNILNFLNASTEGEVK
jgi:hypothetical protein